MADVRERPFERLHLRCSGAYGAVVHGVRAGSRNGLPWRAVIASYFEITRGSDGGAYCLDVLKHWRNARIADDRIAGFARLRTSDVALAKIAIDLFGSCYLGFVLPLCATDARTVGRCGRRLGGRCEAERGERALGLVLMLVSLASQRRSVQPRFEVKRPMPGAHRFNLSRFSKVKAHPVSRPSRFAKHFSGAAPGWRLSCAPILT